MNNKVKARSRSRNVVLNFHKIGLCPAAKYFYLMTYSTLQLFIILEPIV